MVFSEHSSGVQGGLGFLRGFIFEGGEKGRGAVSVALWAFFNKRHNLLLEVKTNYIPIH